MLQCVKKHLLPEGRLFIDCFIPNPKYLTGNPEEKYTIFNKKDLKIERTNTYDPVTQINHIILYYSYQNENWVERLDMKQYYPQELQTYLETNGFEIEESYSDYKHSPMKNNYGLQIYKCKTR